MASKETGDPDCLSYRLHAYHDTLAKLISKTRLHEAHQNLLFTALNRCICFMSKPLD